MFSPLMTYFIAVAREGSFRRAGEKLHVAASSINRQIKDLEEELSTELFERLPRGVRLTAAGQVLFDASRRLQRDYDTALSELEMLRHSLRGVARLATLSVFAEDIVPPIVKELTVAYPELRYSFAVRESAEVAQLVLEDEADIGLSYNPPRGAALEVVKSAEVPFGLVMLPDHPLAAMGSVRMEQCTKYPMALPPSGEIRSLMDRLQSGLAHYEPPLVECDSASMFRELLLNGSVIGLIALPAVIFEVSRGELMFRPLVDRRPVMTELCLYIRRGRKLPPSSGPLLERLKKCFPQENVFHPPAFSRKSRVMVQGERT